jgi:hypothetical protein
MAESFLEDVNNILNTGEITNLYEREDNEKIGILRSQLSKYNIPET